MLKLYNFVFYVIYNSYYKHGNYKNGSPAFTVFFIFVMAFFSQLFFLTELYIYIQNPYARSLGPEFMPGILLILAFIPTYLLFYINKKFNMIYDNHKDNLFANSYPGKIMGWVTLVLFIISPFLLSIIRNKIFFDEWPRFV